MRLEIGGRFSNVRGTALTNGDDSPLFMDPKSVKVENCPH